MGKNDIQDDDVVRAEEMIETGLTMDPDEEEIVDLDALFDALNIAATEEVDAMEFVATDTEGGGILTVSGQALSIDALPSAGDDLDLQTAELLKNTIISDES